MSQPVFCHSYDKIEEYLFYSEDMRSLTFSPKTSFLQVETMMYNWFLVVENTNAHYLSLLKKANNEIL